MKWTPEPRVWVVEVTGEHPPLGVAGTQTCNSGVARTGLAVSAGPDSFNEIGAASFFKGTTRPSAVEMTGGGFRKVM